MACLFLRQRSASSVGRGIMSETSFDARAVYQVELARTEAQIREIELATHQDEDLVLELQRAIAGRRPRLAALEREQLAAKKALAVLDGVAL